MSVRIRLRRVGRKKQPSYRLVVAHGETPRDGAYLDAVGFYNPRTQPARLEIDLAKVDEWIEKGAEMSDTVASLVRKARKGGDKTVAVMPLGRGAGGAQPAEAGPQAEGAVAGEATGRVEPAHLVVGHVSKGHGTKGEVFVWPLTEQPDEVFAEGSELLLGDEEGQLPEAPEVLVIEHSRPFKRGVLVKFEGLEDREAVNELAQRYLLLPAGQLRPLEEGEVFYHQLLGLEVVTREGDVVGRVKEVYETAPSHLLEVVRENRPPVLIPFAEQVVRKVDLEASRIVIAPPPGLLEI